MKLLDLCEPLFQYVCRVNRSARKGGHHTHGQVRDEVKGILTEIKSRAMADPTTANLFEKDRGGIHLVLLFFIDFMVRNSALPFAMDWQNLAYEEQEMRGDEKFFDMLEDALKDRSEGGSERVAIFYTCMGLGFTGWYSGQPEYLRRKMLECSMRLRGQMNADESTPVCPEAYNPDTTVLFRPIGSSLVGMTLTLIVLLIGIFAVNAYVYHRTSQEISNALTDLGKSELAAPPAVSDGTLQATDANRNS